MHAYMHVRTYVCEYISILLLYWANVEYIISIYISIYMHARMHACMHARTYACMLCVYIRVLLLYWNVESPAAWPLHDIAITNIVRCMTFKRGGSVGWRILRNGRAIVSQ